MINSSLNKKINSSLNLLRSFQNSNPNATIEIAYSGGKDSDVILQLAKEAGINFRAIYRNTTIDPPGTINHALQNGCEILQPRRYTFRQLIAKKGLPSRLRRFCCQELKEYKVLDKCVMGVRRDESRSRMHRYSEPTQCRFYGSKHEHVEALYPILDWSGLDVVDFLTDRNVKLHPLYYRDDGTIDYKRRLGCMCCPLASKYNRISEFKKYPGMVKLYLNSYKEFWKNHPDSVAVRTHDSVEEAFVHDVFYSGSKDFSIMSFGLYGKSDYKKLLEDYFCISL